MAKVKIIKAPVVYYWDLAANTSYQTKKKKIIPELAEKIRRKALDVLRVDYDNVPSHQFLKKAGDFDNILLPKTNDADFCYEPTTNTISVWAIFTQSWMDKYKVTPKNQGFNEELLGESTHYTVLYFDEGYTENSPIMLKLKKLKHILDIIVKLGDKAGIDLYKEREIVEKIDSWAKELGIEIREYLIAHKGTTFSGHQFPTDTIPVLGLNFPNAKTIGRRRRSRYRESRGRRIRSP